MQAHQPHLQHCSAHKQLVQPPVQPHLATAVQRARATACSAASVAAAGLPSSPDDDGSMLLLQPYSHPHPQYHAAAHASQQGVHHHHTKQQLVASIRRANSYQQLLQILQDCSRESLTADTIRLLLFQAPRLERAASAAAAAASTSGNGSKLSAASESLAAQQLVCACLQLLLQLNEQVTGWHLSNCLLSLGVLCGRGGPAAAVMAGGSSAAASGASAVDAASFTSTSPSSSGNSSSSSQQAGGSVLQQLFMSPARSSRRDLEALLQATGPQHQLQQLLHATRATAIAAAQPGQLVDMLYGLAVLRVRPAPDVLSAMLQGLHDCLQHQQRSTQQQQQQLSSGGGAASIAPNTSTMAAAAGASSNSSSRPWRVSQAAAAAGPDVGGFLSPKQLSQLLWAAATLQLQLPVPWMQAYWGASLSAIHMYCAQDVANTCWALASRKQQQQQQQQSDPLDSSSSSSSGSLFNIPESSWQQHQQLPPAWQSTLLAQVSAVAGGLTSQGVGNTLWGLAVLEVPVGAPVLQLLLARAMQRCSGAGGMQTQEFANVVWGAARCLSLASQQQQQGSDGVSADAATPPAAAAAECRQQLQVLLQQHGPQLCARFQPRDWSNIMWAAGLAGVQPGKTLLQALWRKTPAGFSTSLNPHYTLAGPGSSSSTAAAAAAAAGGHFSSSSSSSNAAAVQAALLNPTRWSPQALANTLLGCARLRIKPPKVWLQGFEAAAVAVLAGFTDQQLANTLWALGELRQHPSEGWLALFWQQSVMGMMVVGEGQQQQQQQQHVVMVLQACGRLGVEPPAQWLEPATQALLAGAQELLLQQQQQQPADGAVRASQPHTYAAAVHALATLSHKLRVQGRTATSTSNSSSAAALAVSTGQQLMQLLVVGGSSIGQGRKQSRSLPLLQQQQELAAGDVLALLVALPKLQLPATAVHAMGSQLLLLLSPAGQQQQQQLMASQLAQLAYAAASISSYQQGSGRNSNSMHSNAASSTTFWHHLHMAQQQQQQQQKAGQNNSVVKTAGGFVSQLASALSAQVGSMSATDLRFSLAAVAQLQQSLDALQATRSSNGSSSSAASKHKARLLAKQTPRVLPSVAAFAAAGGAAVGTQMSNLTPHQRSVVVASLAALGFCPEPSWFEELLHFSSCELSGSSSADLVRLLRWLPVLLANSQQQQQQQREEQLQQSSRAQLVMSKSSSSSTNTSRVQQQQQGHSAAASTQLLQDWLSDVLSETQRRMGTFSAAQLLRVAQGLARLGTVTSDAGGRSSVDARGPSAAPGATGVNRSMSLSRNQQQYQQQQQQRGGGGAGILQLCVPTSWHSSFLQTAAARLPDMGGPELLMLLTAVRQLRVAPGHSWCAAVADRAVAQAVGAGAESGLRVHHVGWLTLRLYQLGYVPTVQQQAVLLQCVAAACEDPVTASVRPRQLWQLLVLLAAAGWRVAGAAAGEGSDDGALWVQRVQGSPAGQRLRVWLGQRRYLGSWEQVWEAL